MLIIIWGERKDERKMPELGYRYCRFKGRRDLAFVFVIETEPRVSSVRHL